MNNIAKDQNDTERQKYQEPTHEFIKDGSAYFRLLQPNESQQTKMSRLYFCYDMILSLFKEAGRLPALNTIILPH